ncbi:hypothetical protein B0T11DRAFT_228457 [Plectosphaerella cucumerina]|uniref:Replication associated protein n=1 Tax=Plectosphaerella cucumerina TaxID=40658 RepID=A0A8K0X2P1_9PEZI|nr:hypothetical protein B0T11DRAFT_228457 [Plectosphaerella cucumerina]
MGTVGAVNEDAEGHRRKKRPDQYSHCQASLSTRKNKRPHEQRVANVLQPFVLPEKLLWWKEKYFATDWWDRPVLLLRGPSRTGKTKWAESLGDNPMVIVGRFSFDAVIPNASHIVLSDIRWDKFKYWREFLGSQEDFAVTDKLQGEKRVRLGVPVVITCNKDNDPRLVDYIRAYLEDTGAVVVTLEGPLFEDPGNGRK